jgi:hypothetical protein
VSVDLLTPLTPGLTPLLTPQLTPSDSQIPKTIAKQLIPKIERVAMSIDLQDPWTRTALPAIPGQRAAEAAAAALQDADSEESAQVEPLGSGWIAVTVVIGVMAALIALGGMVLSFRAVSTEMVPAFGARWAWLVPVVVDLTVFVFSGVDLVLSRLDMAHPLARWTVYGATGGTVWLNYSAGGSAAGRVAHVLMPAIWVVFVELMRHVVRRQVNLATGNRRQPIPAARWLLSPWPTLKLWRRMVLWRINSYPRALAQEKQRLGAVATAREVHGRLWRYRISPLTRLQINLGEIGASALRTDPTRGPAVSGPSDPASDSRTLMGGPAVGGPPASRTLEADPTEGPIEPDQIEALAVDPIEQPLPVPPRHRSVRESELLTAARQVERWRGSVSATRISRELGIGMPLATSLANALMDEERDLGAVSDGEPVPEPRMAYGADPDSQRGPVADGPSDSRTLTGGPSDPQRGPSHRTLSAVGSDPRTRTHAAETRTRGPVVLSAADPADPRWSEDTARIAREIIAQWRADGTVITRAAFLAELRERGGSASSQYKSALYAYAISPDLPGEDEPDEQVAS